MAHAYTVEFRIYGETLEPETITNELGLNPSYVGKAGTVWGTRVHRHNVWGYSGAEEGLSVDWDSLEDGLAFVLDRLWPHRQQIARYKPEFQIAWWIGHFQSSFDGGPSLSPSILLRLCEFGSAVLIAHYSSDPSDPKKSDPNEFIENE